jgi:hypothetical protein
MSSITKTTARTKRNNVPPDEERCQHIMKNGKRCPYHIAEGNYKYCKVRGHNNSKQSLRNFAG